MQHTRWQQGTKEGIAGMDAKKAKKKINKKDIDSLGLVPKATGERDSARHHSTSQETDRQTAPCRSDT